MLLQWTIKSFQDLAPAELYRVIKLRIGVFMLEQECLYPECDDKDLYAQHLMGVDEAGVLRAYARLLPPGISYQECSIGRVVVEQEARAYGLGKQLMRHALDSLQQQHPNLGIRISAQCYLTRFYQELGFQTVGDTYLEDNIPHIEMYIEATAAC